MELYPWVKAAHIVSVISWMAALLYLPRLFVYHAGTEPGGEAARTLEVMEARLLRVIANPAMIASWVFGLWLAAAYIGFSGGWLHAKLGVVALLTGYHMAVARWRRELAAGTSVRSARFFRVANEVPAVMMVIVVVLVVVRPF